MASTYSSRLRLELIGSGEQGGAWAATANRNIGTLLEEAISGYVAIAFASDANDTADAFDGASDEARNMVVKITGAITAQRNMVFPVQEKVMFVINGTTGGFGVQIIGSSGTGCVVPASSSKWVYCDGTNWNLMSPAAATYDATSVTAASATQALLDLVSPPGMIVPYGGTAAPTGWLLCDGSSLLRATYASLFTAISTTYGAADGTHFTLPDLRGRVVAGQDDMGGSSANRLTGVSGSVDGDVLGGTGGAETISLTAAQSGLQAHTHTMAHTHQIILDTKATVSQSGSGEYVCDPASESETGTATFTSEASSAANTGSNSTASGSAHHNVQPTIILNYIIRTGLTT